MGLITKIQWCDHTFNPWRGCTKVAAGCANCYAEKLSRRNPNVLGIWGENGTRVVASEQMWAHPGKWNRIQPIRFGPVMRPRVFCASLADVFEDWSGCPSWSNGNAVCICEDCGDGFREFGSGINPPHCADCDSGAVHMASLDDVRRRLFRVIDETDRLDWLLLTKRPENIRWMISDIDDPPKHGTSTQESTPSKRRQNLWLGTSVAVQEDLERNWRLLAECRDLARVLFLSIEPLVGPVDLSWMRNKMKPDWVIVGGESGPKARPCNAAWWIRDIVEQCQQALVPCFVKQLGSHTVWNDSGFVTHMILNDKKGGDPDEWPGYLRVREFPRGGGK